LALELKQGYQLGHNRSPCLNIDDTLELMTGDRRDFRPVALQEFWQAEQLCMESVVKNVAPSKF